MASTETLPLIRRRIRRLVVPLALSLAGLLGWSLLAATTDVGAILAPPGPIYTVAEVRANLARDSYTWAGRTILMRGEIVPCLAIPSVGEQPCAALAPSGWQPRSPAPGRPIIDPLPVVYAGLDPFLARIRSLPLLGDLLPASEVLQWGAVATYRVRLRASVNSICGAGVCYEAVLLVAVP